MRIKCVGSADSYRHVQALYLDLPGSIASTIRNTMPELLIDASRYLKADPPLYNGDSNSGQPAISEALVKTFIFNRLFVRNAIRVNELGELDPTLVWVCSLATSRLAMLLMHLDEGTVY